jgi:hypothetical protein
MGRSQVALGWCTQRTTVLKYLSLLMLDKIKAMVHTNLRLLCFRFQLKISTLSSKNTVEAVVSFKKLLICSQLRFR